MTYDELVTNIRNYTDVDANVLSEAVIDTFILLTGNRILREVDLDVFKKRSRVPDTTTVCLRCDI